MKQEKKLSALAAGAVAMSLFLGASTAQATIIHPAEPFTYASFTPSVIPVPAARLVIRLRLGGISRCGKAQESLNSFNRI
jgi:hypothetical protein